jgi:AraC family transcriptional regulator of adaptative response/methylated-DNA-[protein]-cysteine methyltransferase
MNQEQNIFEELQAIDEETRWQAVQAKDARFNGIFFYGVRSTGIYCKPSCPSRRPRREQVLFFASFKAAETEGFRACLRCHPRDAVEGRDYQLEMVKRACRIIEAQTEGPLSLDSLGKRLNVSPHHLQRTFKQITGVSPRQYAAAHRLEQFKLSIKEGRDVTGAMYEAGYGSSRGLYEKASEQLGMTPATYQRGGKGMSINYTIVNCHLGRLLVAATERGVCAVNFGDDDQQLEAALSSSYGAALIRRDETHLNDSVNALLRHLDGSQPHLDLPLDVQATAFQLRVWEELRKIPYGATRSYGEIANSIGRPSASRAVAQACAANPVALVNPCHRVVRGSGNISGYRWGTQRKHALLEHEKAQSTKDHALSTEAD